MKKLLKKINLKSLKPFWPILVILVTSIILLRSFFTAGFPETHDGQLYLARMANFHFGFVFFGDLSGFIPRTAINYNNFISDLNY